MLIMEDKIKGEQMFEFNFVKGSGLQVTIDKDKLAELMDKKEEARQEDMDYLEEEKNDRTEEQQAYHDTGIRSSDFM